MINRRVVTDICRFDKPQTLTTTPAANGWTLADTSAAGAPTALVTGSDGGSLDITLAATSEVENVCAFFNDVLTYDLAMIQNFWYIARFTAQADSVTTVVLGMGSARNDTLDSVATNVWFRIEGSASTSNIVCETDDNVTDNDDKATGVGLLLVYKTLFCDLTNGLADVKFKVDGQPVANATTFSMTGLTSGLNVQPIIQIQKASGTGVPGLAIAEFGIQYKRAYGA